MRDHDRQDVYRQLPAVDEVLRGEAGRGWLERFPHDLVVRAVRGALDMARERIAREDGAAVSLDWVEKTVGKRLSALERPSLRAVINASGVILHTNLGRAPLSPRALAAIAETAGGYSNLEYDLDTGKRGRRDVHAGSLLRELLGAPAIVVNNNAAAIFLVLNALASGGEVVVSRGELIEIGDGFRIPDILAQSGARLVEVGTTNRTRIEDYRAAIGEQTRALLRVHPSNFRIVGFTSRPELRELADLGRERGLPVIEDLGSGSLYDFSSLGFEDEPPAATSLRQGVDLITFSGDKLLGGPQCGVIAGREMLVQRVRRNPLFRALRVDKLSYAALEATLRDYLLERFDDVPVLRMARLPLEEIRGRAERIRDELMVSGVQSECVEAGAVLGGGSTPARTLPTVVVAIAPAAGDSASEFEARLRVGEPAVIARIENERLLLDPRTVAVEQLPALVEAVRRASGVG